MDKKFFKKLKGSVFEFSPFQPNGFSSIGKALFDLPEFCRKDVSIDSEIIFSQSQKLINRFKNNKILVVGGGSSANDLDYENLEYDAIWSANKFYLHPILSKIKIDLVMLMGGEDFHDQPLIDYVHSHNPFIGFEWCEKLLDFPFKHNFNYFFSHTKFYSKLGACPRMIILACYLGVKEIHFCGMDGIKHIEEGKHAFEPGKKDKPFFFTYETCLAQYKLFWGYIKAYFPEVKFKNLGAGQEFHNL